MPNGLQQSDKLLEVIGLGKYFPVEKGFLRRVSGYCKAVDDVDFCINVGETLGLVGESGSGKTTCGRCVLRAIEPTKGKVLWHGSDTGPVNITGLDNRTLRGMRKNFQMIFQDPYSSLNPRMTAYDIISEPLRVNREAKGSDLQDRVSKVVDLVGLDMRHMKRYPHAFSGGQRQRIGIARCLILQPKLIVADEAVSALDVSVQAQVLNLLRELQQKFDLAFLFITHDFSVVEYMSDRVAVMYLGKIVELGQTENIFTRPRHPYTAALIASIGRRGTRAKVLAGEVPDPVNPPAGCHFHPRCPHADEICRQQMPDNTESKPGHFVRCHFADRLQLKGVSAL